MADKSKIEWTDATWNPITGCTVISPGCTNCYAMKLAGTRLRNHPSRKGLTEVVNGNIVWTGEVRFNERWLREPSAWKAPRQIFVCAHGDAFHPSVKDEWLDLIFDEMELADHHVYQVLTKRSERQRNYIESRYAGKPTPDHIWLGISVENQKFADARRDNLAACAKLGFTTFCSYEPALGLVDWTGWEFLRWLISGGESGPRPAHPDWFRAARNFCAAHGIAYFHKQNGSWTVIVDREAQDPDWRADYNGMLMQRGYRILNIAGGQGFHGERVHMMRHVGKKAAGRLLDGITHDATPSPPDHVITPPARRAAAAE